MTKSRPYIETAFNEKAKRCSMRRGFLFECNCDYCKERKSFSL